MSRPDTGLVTAADELASRLRHHASVLSAPDPDPAEVVAAADAVGTAAERYSTEVFDRTGWGSPFTPPPADEVDSGPADALDEDGDIEQLRVSADYAIAVTSEDGLRRLVTSRELPAERPPDGGESTVVDLVAALFRADGWDLESYGRDGVDGSVVSWVVEPAGDKDDAAG